MIPYARQDIDQADIDAVVDVLRSDWMTQGPAVARFERAVADYCGVDRAVAVASGTAALHLACRAVGFGPGDTLWTSPNSFVASANCAIYCGGVNFVDMDARNFNMSAAALERKLEQAARQGRLPSDAASVLIGREPPGSAHACWPTHWPIRTMRLRLSCATMAWARIWVIRGPCSCAMAAC